MASEGGSAVGSDDEGISIATMRPSGAGLAWLGVRIEFFLVAIGVRNLLFGGYPEAASAFFIVTTAALAGLLVMQWRTARRRVTLDGIVVTNLWGRSHLISHRDISTVMSARHVEFAISHYRCIAVLDPNGRALLRAKADHWNAQSMTDLTAALGDKVEYVPEPVTQQELLRRFPFAFNFVTRHPYRTLLILIAVLVAFGIGVDAFARSLA